MFNYIHSLYYKNIKKSYRNHRKNLIFDMKSIDDQISKLSELIYKKYRKEFNNFEKFNTKIGFMASQLYDTGGHTHCLVNLANSFYQNKKLPIYLSRFDLTKEFAPITCNKLSAIGNIITINNIFRTSYPDFCQHLIEYHNKIISNLSKVIVVYIHPDDILSTALIHILKQTTDVKIIFFNHASHCPVLAMTMADIIAVGRKNAAKIHIEKAHITTIPYKICGLQSRRKKDIKYYTKEEINHKRLELGISNDELLTVSGGASYKYFENNSSAHFEMIKRLLEKIPNLKHLAITNLSQEEDKIINKIFKGSEELKKRLIIHPLTSEYEILFQSADLFIDSFPISSAMTQIDLMSMKIPTVVKINSENPAWSFHEYMPPDYPFMYEQIEDMEKGIFYLLSKDDERFKITESNYQYWLKNYESDCVKEKYESMINELNV